MRKELVNASIMGVHGVGTVNEEKSYQNEYEDHVRFVDDITGRPLNPELVAEARADEVRGANAHNVWTKVPISECYQRTGKPPIGGRWVDHNKGDDINPDIRCRYVGRDFKNDTREDLFAATPPLKAINALLSLAASQCNRTGPVRKL